MPASDASRNQSNKQGEIDGEVVYRAMAVAEKNPSLASVYTRLAEIEAEHLDFWDRQLRAIGVEPGPRRVVDTESVLVTNVDGAHLRHTSLVLDVSTCRRVDERFRSHVCDMWPTTSGGTSLSTGPCLSIGKAMGFPPHTPFW